MSRKINELDRVRVVAGSYAGLEFTVRKIDRLMRRKGLFIWGQVNTPDLKGNLVIEYRNCELVKQAARNRRKRVR